MKSSFDMLDENASRPIAGPGIEGRILRLVKGGVERRAIEVILKPVDSGADVSRQKLCRHRGRKKRDSGAKQRRQDKKCIRFGHGSWLVYMR